MKFSVSASGPSPAGAKPGRALRGRLDHAEATSFWQAHEDESEHLTLVLRGHAQRPVEFAAENEVSIKLYAMSVCDALAMAARFVEYARALSERERDAPPPEGAVWTEREAIPACSAQEREQARAGLEKALAGLGPRV